MPRENRLGKEKSPYLLSHARNPVDWYPWGKEAFDRAKEEDKPIFLSIGYAACHWCHVMERECFDDEEVAELLNDVCVSIKVDREERPDLDALFTEICQIQNGNSGWPLNLFLTPWGEPFFAATFLPKRTMGKMPGLADIAPRVKWLWLTQKEDVLRGAKDLVTKLTARSLVVPGGPLGL
ncbi:MAG: thioredoxin domain-containing protein, partial [Synergistaceae bacterium]|nr:thioredoxin domain-containing protein [Synergistaceae bacterium]